jgi:hypothetical protein
MTRITILISDNLFEIQENIYLKKSKVLLKIQYIHMFHFNQELCLTNRNLQVRHSIVLHIHKYV